MTQPQEHPRPQPHFDAEFQSRVLESSLDCIKVLDLEGRLLSMNAGGMAMLEICSLEPYLGSSWIDFWEGEDRRAAADAVARARAGGVGRFVGRFATVETRRPMRFDVVVSPILGASGLPERLIASSRDVTSWKQTEEMLHAVTEGTAGVTGQAFFDALARQLAHSLGVQHAFIAECSEKGRARMLSWWDRVRPGERVEYDLAGTPCADVVGGETAFHPAALCQLFPADAMLAELGLQSYLGVPLRGSDGQVIGHLAVMDTAEMPPDATRRAVLESFASRAGAEIERANAQAQLDRLMAELRLLLDMNRAIGRRLERDELFGAIATCLRDLVETDRFGIELPIEGNRLQGHLLTPHQMREQPTRLKVLPRAGTACNWVLERGEWLVSASRDELRERFPLTHEVMEHEGMQSLCALPLSSEGRARAVLYFMSARTSAYGELPRRLLEQIAAAVAVALDDCLAHEQVRELRDRLAAENRYLQEEIRSEHNFSEIIGRSSKVGSVLSAIEQVAPTGATALILGETGTGKELVARAIHHLSPRRDRPLVKVNCAAISSGLVESELFGHVRGAFTGAHTSRDGRFKLADGGTLFLDEVGELALETQAKLLRVLQEKEFEPIGSSRTQRVDVRVIAATNRDLEAAVREGRFRSDLYYRLNVFPIAVPPLRERIEDIELLAHFFADQCAARFGKPLSRIDADTLERLRAYSWPGNVRELQNVIERAMVLATSDVLRIDRAMLPERTESPREAAAVAAPPIAGATSDSLDSVQRQHILAVLERCAWRIEGARGAARALSMSPSTLRSRMQRLGIGRPAN